MQNILSSSAELRFGRSSISNRSRRFYWGVRRYSLTSALAVLLMGVAAYAQVTGIPPFSTIAGGPDAINLGNLNVHFSVPVRSKVGRGLPFSYSTSIDSSLWTPIEDVLNSVTTWTPASSFGVTTGTVGALGAVYFRNFSKICTVRGRGTTIWGETLSFTDATGTSHSGPTVYQVNGCGWANTYTGTISDGSGVSWNAVGGDGGNPTSATITMPNGDVIVPPIVNSSGAIINGSTFTWTDSNGNQIVVTSQGSTNYLSSVTDTLHSPGVLSSTGAVPSPVLYTYNPPSGTPVSVTVSYQSYTVQTAIGCSGINEFGPTSESLINRITLPDLTYYQITYEPTTTGSSNVTGRIASVRLPTGGTISYTYIGGDTGTGWFCADGSTAGFQRSTPDGTWKYVRSAAASQSAITTTTVTDPQTNVTKYYFLDMLQVERQVYTGPATGTPLEADVTCYNGTPQANCVSPVFLGPIAEITSYKSLNGGPQSEVDTFYNTYGLVTAKNEYDFGATIPSRMTTISYDQTLGNGVVDRPSVQRVTDGSGNPESETDYTYDEDEAAGTLQASGALQLIPVSCTASSNKCRGNVTTLKSCVSFSSTAPKACTSYLTKTAVHYDTGQVYTANDVNGATTTYTYGACGNSLLTNVSLPLGLSESYAWNCIGAVMTSSTDENSKISYTNYTTDPYFWRPESTQDALGNVTSLTYTGATRTEAVLPIVSGQSSVDAVNTLDSLGRPYLTQRRQAPGSTSFDTGTRFYDSDGRPYEVTMPCVKTIGLPCPITPSTSTTYDGAGRPSVVTDGGNGTVTTTYPQHDILSVVGPAPTGEHTKSRQIEYDGLGRISWVCEVSSSSGAPSCGSGRPSGYLTSYAYGVPSSGGTQMTVTQGVQTRTYVYDGLGRLTSETNPESGATTYKYDSVTGAFCGGSSNSSPGNLMLINNANGTNSCYVYDALHRVTEVGFGGTGVCKRFRYDNASNGIQTPPTGSTMNFPAGRLVEAETDNCQNFPHPAAITDEWFSYSARGEETDAYESTPNSGGYYHTSATYYPNGALNTLGGISGVQTTSYGLDGEGRPYSAADTSGDVQSVTYNAASQPLVLQYTSNGGAGDLDTYTYDPTTGRMKTYTFTIGATPKSVVGTYGWNANGTLQTLAVTDPFYSVNQKTCTYTYDDLGRVGSPVPTNPSFNCTNSAGTTVWSQTFSYDQYGNISKSGSSAFQPNYVGTTNQMFSLPGAPVCNSSTGASVCYDGSGNLVNDSFNTYTWDAYGNMASINGGAVTYDAFDREVEKSGPTQQILYGPIGRMAIMNGQTWVSAFIPLPGGSTMMKETISGNVFAYVRHTDFQGTVTVESTLNGRAMNSDKAFAPFGEVATTGASGNGDTVFGGLSPDTLGGTYDALYRKENPGQGRWISPDPAGIGAASPGNPQSWNRYAYTLNNPLSATDPTGLCPANAARCPDVRPAPMDEGWNDPSNLCNVDGVPTPCTLLTSESELMCPNNDCSLLQARYTGKNGGSFSLVAATNGYEWVNNFNGDELDMAGAIEAGLDTPVSISTLPADPNNLRLVTDKDRCRGGDRRILYHLVGSGGGSAPGTWWVTEQLQTSVSTNSGATNDTPNYYDDWITQFLSSPHNAIQSFRISLSPNPGSRSFPVLVNIGGKDYGKLGLWISKNPLRNGQPSPDSINCPPE